MNKPNQLYIIGGGTSIPSDINVGLKEFLKNKFVIGINYAYNYFPMTALCYCDNDFYSEEYEKLKDIPLILGNWFPGQRPKPLDNVFTFRAIGDYYRDIIHGVYKPSLTGIFALTLGIYLLDVGEIYCLGFDYGEKRTEGYTEFATSLQRLNEITVKDEKGRPLTHFYQKDITHRGTGKIDYYNMKDRAKNDFDVYGGETDVKIYNVSKISKITTFETITYAEMFKLSDSSQNDQDELRKWIKMTLDKGGIKNAH